MGAAPPRRLAVVSDSVHPWNTGGKERRHHELLTRLAARGVAVDIYTMRWWGGEEKSIVLDGITYHALCRHIPLYAGKRRSIFQAVVFALASLRMVTRRFDVIEADAIPFLQLFPVRVVAWVRRVPMVVTWHEFWGTDYWVEYLGPLGHVAARLERVAVALPTRIIAASAATAERLSESSPRSLDVRVVPNGVSFESLRAAADVAPPGGDQIRLICIGRMLDHKKVDVAIEATAELRDRGLPVHLRLIGEGPEREDLMALVSRLELDDVVEFTTFLDEHADVLCALAQSHVLLFPSIREGFGMAALEAMAVGTPVVTSDHPDNFARHLIVPGVNGFAVPAEAARFADSVLATMADREALAAGATRTARDYDWDRMTDEAQKAYGC